MKRFLVFTPIMFVLYLLQTVVFQSFMPALGVSPNYLLIFTVSLALLRGDVTGIIAGFFAGLAIDMVFGDFIGAYALIYMFLGFIAGKFHFAFSSGRFFLAMLVISICDLIYGFVNYVLFFLLRARFDLGFYMMHVILPEVVFTLAVSCVIYPLLYLLNDLLEEDELRRARKFV